MQKYYQYVFYLVFLISANANANPRDYEIGERIYELCAQQTSAVFQKMRKQVQGDKDSEVCFEVSQECNYDGDTDNYTKLKGKRTKQCVDGSVFDDLDCDNSGRCMPRDRKKCPGGKNCGGDDGIDIDGGGSVTVPGACYRKCRKGVDKKKCRKCLRKYDAIDPSCSRPSKCGDIIIDDGEDEDDGSGRKRKKRRGDKDGDCVDCKSRAYPPGTGFANVVGALGGFIQSAGIGLGASGVMSYLDKKDCRNKFTTHNQQRIENSQSMLDYTSKICPGNVGGGFYGGGGGGGYYGNPAYGGIGSYPGSQYAFNGGALGQYNPQAGISLNAGLGGLFGGQFGGGGQFGNGGQWGGGNGYGNGGQWGGVNGYANGGQGA